MSQRVVTVTISFLGKVDKTITALYWKFVNTAATTSLPKYMLTICREEMNSVFTPCRHVSATLKGLNSISVFILTAEGKWIENTLARYSLPWINNSL